VSHTCVVARSAEERLEAVAAFLTEPAPSARNRVVLTGCVDRVELAGRLRAWDLDLPALEVNRHVLLLPRGVDAAVAMDFLPLSVSGVRRLLVWADPSLCPCEHALHTLATCRDIDVLCHYRAHDLTRDLRDQVRSCHDHVREIPAVYDDGILRITERPDSVVHLAGECDLANVHALRSRLDDLVRIGPRVLDLSRTRFVDARTTMLLADLVAQRRITLRRAPEMVDHLLRLARGAPACAAEPDEALVDVRGGPGGRECLPGTAGRHESHASAEPPV
jgi:hypothetical protein